MTTKTQEALKLALEALEETRNALAWFYDSYPQDVTEKGNELLPHVETVLTAIREALMSFQDGASEASEQSAQQQEPVAWARKWDLEALPNIPETVDDGYTAPGQQLMKTILSPKPHEYYGQVPLYTYPQPNQRSVKPWRGLTDEEIEKLAVESGKATFLNDDEQTDILWFDGDCICLARAIEAKLKEKNNG